MEQRKLIKHGESSLTISLPKKWLEERGLSKGDSLFIDKEQDKLILTTGKAYKLEKKSVDITKLDRTSAILYLQSLYRFGYNEIELRFRKQRTIHYRRKKEVTFSSEIHYMMSRLMGVEIIEEDKDRILIKQLTKETDQNFKVIMRRIFLLLNEVSETLLEGIKNVDVDQVASVESKHDNINKFVNYCLRLLNKYGYSDTKKTYYYFHIIASIDKIVDIIKYNARNFLKYKKGFCPETIEIWERVNKSIRAYYGLFYNFNFDIVNQLNQNRDKTKLLLKSKAKKIPHAELIYLTSTKQILEIILDLTDFRMGLEY